MTNRAFAELSARQVAERITAQSVLIQPIAAVEQHGPHLPLATDLIVAETAARAVVDERGDDLDLWLLPPLAYGRSLEHTWRAGTITLSTTTLLAVLDDVGRSVACTAARRLAFVNGHGGNTSLLNVACRDLRLHHGLMTFLLHPSLPPDHGGSSSAAAEMGMGIHAGQGETSLLLHLRPDLVDMDAAARAVPEHLAANDHVRFGGVVSFGWLSDDFGPSGVIGDPTAATAEEGKAAYERIIASLGDQLAEVARFTFTGATRP